MLGSIMVRSSAFVNKKDVAEIINMLDKKTVYTREREYTTFYGKKYKEITISISGVVDLTYVHIVCKRKILLDERRLNDATNRVTALTVLDVEKRKVMTEDELKIHTILEEGTRLIRPM